MPSYADLCQLMLSYAELCWVMPSYASLCRALRITLSALMKWLHLFCHITFFEKMRKSYFPPTFTRIQMIRSYICDHQKRSSYQSNHNSRIAFDILSAFAIIQKEKTLISYRLRYLTIWPSFPSWLICDTYKRRQLWRDKRLSGCHVEVFDSTLNCRDNDREKRQWKIYALGLN